MPVLSPSDHSVVGYRVTILINPKLGTPVDLPHATPKWAASRVLVVTLAPQGDRLIQIGP